MPLFIIISGLFHKDKSMIDTIKNVLKKLILPYVICTLLLSIISNIINGAEIGISLINWIKQICFSYSYWGNIRFEENVPALGPLWFFTVLACIKLIFCVIKNISKNDELKLFFYCIIITYMGYMLGIKGYWLPFSLDIAMASIVFYYIGYIFTKKNLLMKIIEDKKILIIVLLIWIIGIKYNCIELATRGYSNGTFSFLTAICGTIILIKYGMLIEKYLKWISKALVWYGKNSMFILLLHYLELSLINYNLIFNDTNSTILKLKIIILKICIITIGTYVLKNLYKLLEYIKSKFIEKKELNYNS